MSEKVVIRAFVSTWKVGSEIYGDYETEYTPEEWVLLSEEKREEIIEEFYQEHRSSYSDGNAWVKTEDDED